MNNKLITDNIYRILQSMYDEVLIADGKGVVIYVSPGFEKDYGISKEQAEGKTVYELENAGYLNPSIIAIVIEEQKTATIAQKTLNNKEILVTASPIFDDKGEIEIVVSYARDVTEIRQIERAYSSMKSDIDRYEAELNELRKENIGEGVITGNSEKMRKIDRTINHIADMDVNILITGESGTGKSLVARLIHEKSHISEGPFIEIDCTVVPEKLLEAELFGSGKKDYGHGGVGLAEMADGGTLLIEEISELPLQLQGELAVVLREKRIWRAGDSELRIGASDHTKANFRLIATSSKDLKQMTREGSFRTDLFYALNVVNIELPPLRERAEDIIPLIKNFAEVYNDKYKTSKAFLPKAIEQLMQYSWPGNVRELANVIEKAIVTSESATIEVEDLSEEVRFDGLFVGSGEIGEIDDLTTAIEKYESKILNRAYETYGTTTGVAKALNISQPTAFRKIEKYVNKKAKKGE